MFNGKSRTATAQFSSDSGSSGVGGSGVIGALPSGNICVHVKSSCELVKNYLCSVCASDGLCFNVSGELHQVTGYFPVSHEGSRIASSVNGSGRGASELDECASGEESRGVSPCVGTRSDKRPHQR